MKTRLLLLFFAINIWNGGASAQTKVRIRVLDENDQPLKFVRLILSGTNLPIETQSNGEYTLEFPPNQTELVFYPPDKFERISPPNGTILLPEDKTRTIDIWLARKSGDNRELESFTRVLSKKEEDKARLKIENEQLKSRLEKFELGHETSAPMRDSLAALRDSIVAILRQNTSNAAALTREIDELQETVGLKRQLFYKKIAGELAIFDDRLKDLRDALPRVRDAFIDEKSMVRFDKIIGAYNVARDSLLQNHRGHAEIVRALWGADAYEKLADVYEQTLIEVHQKTVLPLNTTLIDQFRAVRAEETRPAKARKKAENSANSAFEKLNVQIPILEKQTSQRSPNWRPHFTKIIDFFMKTNFFLAAMALTSALVFGCSKCKESSCAKIVSIIDVQPKSNPSSYEVLLKTTGFSSGAKVLFGQAVASTRAGGSVGEIIAKVPDGLTGNIEISVEEGDCIARFDDFTALGDNAKPVGVQPSLLEIIIPTPASSIPTGNFQNFWVNAADPSGFNFGINLIGDFDGGNTSVFDGSHEFNFQDDYFNNNPVTGTASRTPNKISLKIDRTAKIGGTIEEFEGQFIEKPPFSPANVSLTILLVSKQTGRQLLLYYKI